MLAFRKIERPRPMDEDRMDEEKPRMRQTRFTRAARIGKRARDGFAYDARGEGTTVRRVQ